MYNWEYFAYINTSISGQFKYNIWPFQLILAWYVLNCLWHTWAYAWRTWTTVCDGHLSTEPSWGPVISFHWIYTANNRRSGAWRFNDLLLGKSSGLYETLEIPGWLFRNVMWSPTIVPKCEYFVCSVAFNTS